MDFAYVGESWFRDFDEHCKLMEGELSQQKREILARFNLLAHFWFGLGKDGFPLFVKDEEGVVSVKLIKYHGQEFSELLKEFDT